MSKNLKSLTQEELMQIAKTPLKEDEFKKLPPVRRFIVSSDIQNGDYPIPGALIYDRYQNWCDAYKVRCLDKTLFFKELALYFDKKRTREGNAYVMSPKGFDLSPAYLEYVNQKQKPKKRISNGETAAKKKTKEKHQD